MDELETRGVVRRLIDAAAPRSPDPERRWGVPPGAFAAGIERYLLEAEATGEIFRPAGLPSARALLALDREQQAALALAVAGANRRVHEYYARGGRVDEEAWVAALRLECLLQAALRRRLPWTPAMLADLVGLLADWLAVHPLNEGPAVVRGALRAIERDVEWPESHQRLRSELERLAGELERRRVGTGVAWDRVDERENGKLVERVRALAAPPGERC